MNNKQFNKIKERLVKWRKDRYLTYEIQKKGFLGNTSEEVSEYFRAKDDYERIDALMDITVFTINSFNFKYTIGGLRVNDLYDFSSVLLNLATIAKEISKYNKANCSIHESDIVYEEKIIKMNNLNLDFKNIMQENSNNLLNNIENISKDLGFDFYKCMLETIKEIESRTGYYNKDLHKFVKDTGAYTEKEAENKFIFSIKYKEDKDFWYFLTLLGIKKVKKWYKANYEQCKLRD